MAKILKYKFKTPILKVVGNDLIEDGYQEEEYTFTLLHKGIGLYEEITGESLLKSLAKLNQVAINTENAIGITKDFIPNLAMASYIKIEDGNFHNNLATANEFKKKPIYSRCSDDFAFQEQLVQMAIECINSKTKTKESNTSKKM